MIQPGRLTSALVVFFEAYKALASFALRFISLLFLESTGACLHIMGNYFPLFDAESTHANY